MSKLKRKAKDNFQALEEPECELDIIIKEEIISEDEDDLKFPVEVSAKKRSRSSMTPEAVRKRAERANMSLEKRLAMNQREAERRRKQRQQESLERRKLRLEKERNRQKERKAEGKIRKKAKRPSKKDIDSKFKSELEANGVSQEEIERLLEERKKARKEKQRFDNYVRRINMTDEQREELRLKKYFYWQSKSKEDKLRARERNRESIRRSVNKYYHEKIKTDPEKKKKFQENVQRYLKKRVANESPEQRQKRLHGYKVNQAIQRLRKKLRAQNVPEEEIREKVEELRVEMKNKPLPPLESISVYRPRPERAPRKYRKTKSEVNDIGSVSVEKQAQIPDKVKITPTPPNITFTNCVNNLPPEFKIVIPPSHPTSLVKIDHPPNSDPPSIVEEVEYNDTPALEPEPESLQFKIDAKSQPQPVFIPISPNCPLSKEHFEVTEISEVAEVTVGSIIIATTFPFDDDTSNDQYQYPCEEIIFLQCPHCPDMFPTDLDIREHIRTTHPKMCWKCPKCKQVVLSPSELTEHFRTHHPTPTSTSTSKVISNPTPPVTPAPVKTVNLNKLKFTCVKCPELSRFATHTELKEHVRDKHPESFWPCSHCDILKYSEKNLEIHVKSCVQLRSKLKKSNS